MQLTNCVPAHPEDTFWDVVVIGTGAGGATAGYTLARLGRSVLFLEQGPVLDAAGSPARPRSWDSLPGAVHSTCPPYDTEHDEIAPSLYVGKGLGGTTSLFSMVMDRFRPADLRPRDFAKVPPSTSLPDAWPIQHEDLEPYYREAETLFRIRGTDDPLAPTRSPLQPPLRSSETETMVHDALTRNGLHPYRLHYAREHLAGCDGCVAKPCPRDCRNDSARMCIIPALEHHEAQILPDCRVSTLETSGRSVRQAICFMKGNRIAIRGRIFVLALGALATPALLLRSANDSFPAGLGNSSGLVGRNLMLHVSDSLLVQFKTHRGLLNSTLHNGLSLNDFYIHDGLKLGNIHAHGMDFTQLPTLPPISTDSAGAVLFSTIVDDFPYPENHVFPKTGSDEEILWEYTYPEELHFRSRLLTTAFAKALRATCEVVPIEPTGQLNRSHMCGTCRFGNDSCSSVLDWENRIHDLDNAYIVDSSFFPSSSGINPSLTIVANSLRVSRLLARR